MLANVNKFLESKIAILTLVCMIIGIAGSDYIVTLAAIVPWLLAFMTFYSSTGISVRQIKELVHSPFPIIVCLLLLQVVVPALAYTLGHIFFLNDLEVITGLVLAFIIPTAVASLIWVSFYEGNLSLALTVVIINTVLSPVVIPITLYLLFHTVVSVPLGNFINGLFWMIAVPSFAGLLVNHFSKGNFQRRYSYFAPFSKLALLLIILINGSIVAPYFTEQLSVKVGVITFTVFIIAFSAYMIGFVVAKLFSFEKKQAISLIYTCGMRNIGLGSAIAIVYFSPAVALPVVVATLFQQILASFIGQTLIKNLIRKSNDSDPVENDKEMAI